MEENDLRGVLEFHTKRRGLCLCVISQPVFRPCDSEGGALQLLFPQSSIHQRRLEVNLSEETLCSRLDERWKEFREPWRRSRCSYSHCHPPRTLNIDSISFPYNKKNLDVLYLLLREDP